jgi:CheY-like chemotaxis protein
MKPNVIVAEDDPDMREVVSEALELMGAVVTRAESGADLIQHLSGGAYDLIITDISMPWMSGLQVALSVRRADIQTPVIVMTGSTKKDLVAQVDALGGHTRLLRKPFGMHELHDAVTAMVPRLS